MKTKAPLFALAASLALLPLADAQSQTVRTYVGAGTDITNISNWSPNTPAFANGDTLRWDNQITGNLSLSTTSATTYWVNLSLTSAQVSNVAISASENNFRIRNITIDSGAGALSISGGLRTEGTSAGGTMFWTNNSSNTATISTTFNNTNNSTTSKDIRTSGQGSWLISGTLTGNHDIGWIIEGPGLTSITSTSNNNNRGTSVLGGTLQVSLLANGGSASSIGDTSNAASNLILNGGTLSLVSTAARSTDRLFQLGQTTASAIGTIENNSSNSSHTLSFTNTGSITYGTTNQTRTLRLGGSNTGANSLAVTIGDNGSGAVSLEKQGAGRWDLTNASNSYTGGTTVSAGTLVLTDTGVAGSGQITASGGTTRIAASATMNNDIVVTSPTATVERLLSSSAAFNLGVGAGSTFTGNLVGGMGSLGVEMLDGGTTAARTLTASFSTINVSATNDSSRKSDIFSLTGTGGDTFVLQLSITDPVSPNFVLGWYDPGTQLWVNAVAGNVGGTPLFAGNRAYNPLTDFSIGTYGVDTTAGTVWAVLNHNSQFAIIPEPHTSVLLICAAGFALWFRRRLRKD